MEEYERRQQMRQYDAFFSDMVEHIQEVGPTRRLLGCIKDLPGKGWKKLGFAQRDGLGISKKEVTDVLANFQRLPVPTRDFVIDQLVSLPQIQELREAETDLKTREMGYLVLQQRGSGRYQISQGFFDSYTTCILGPTERAYQNALVATRQAFKAYTNALDTTRQAYETGLITDAHQIKVCFKSFLIEQLNPEEQLNPFGVD